LLNKIPGYRPLTETFENYIGSQWAKYAPYSDKYVSAPLDKFIQSYNDWSAKTASKIDSKINPIIKSLVPKEKLTEPVERLLTQHLINMHGSSEGIMVPAKTAGEGLIKDGYDAKKIRYWSRGVDTTLFHPSKRDPNYYKNMGFKGPISLYVGRIEDEKNLRTYLMMFKQGKVQGTPVLIGMGSKVEALQGEFPEAKFLGRKDGEELAKAVASADVFVFSSVTDTFGQVMREANASGLPVAAFAKNGPLVAVSAPESGVLAPYTEGGTDEATQANVEALAEAWHKASKLSREGARKFAEQFGWQESTLQFMYFLHRLPSGTAKQ
jgi:glycosyltransferase involved in cell wall biosynthesis